MMKTLITTIALATMVSLVQGAELSTKEAWAKVDLSPDERTALVGRSKAEPFDQIAPILLKALIDCHPFSGRDETYLMASAVWQHHMTPTDDSAKAKVVLSLLQKASGKAEQTILIGTILKYQWCPEAESVLLDLARNTEEDLGIRRSSISTLLRRCDINTYMPLAVEIVLAHKNGLDRCQAFTSTLELGNRFFSLSDANRRKVLATGFDIIAELPDKDLQTGYFVARRLGFMLKQEDEFAPNQKALKYQGTHGLTDEFFTDTVRAAVKWYSEQKKDIEGN